MKIARTVAKPKPPPVEFTLTFSRDEGWAIVSALRDYADRHPDAKHGVEWKRWAILLDRELRA